MDRYSQELQEGDDVTLIHMEDENLMVGTKGTVIKLNKTPWGIQYTVKWNNGSTLDLIPGVDKWLKSSDIKPRSVDESSHRRNVKKKIILESDSREKNLRDNLSFLKYVRDRKSVFDFLRELQNSGLTNMLAATPFLTYSSADLKTYIRGQFKDPDEYLDLIDAADKSRDALINGVMKKLEEEGKDDFDLSEVNKEFRNLTRQAMSLYVGNYEAFINRE